MNGNNVLLLRALRGPVMMMTLGGVLALDHFTRYSFESTWPVLLIMLGAMILLERMARPDTPPPGPLAPMGGN